jgi:hypothetical protein
MPEIALNVPFDSGEICQIVGEELQARLRGLSPLQGNKEYAAFSVEFQVKIKLLRAGEQPTEARDTLAWGKAEKGILPSAEDLDAASQDMEISEATSSTYESKDPNEERVERDMPLTVETGDGRGGKIRKKVKVKA